MWSVGREADGFTFVQRKPLTVDQNLYAATYDDDVFDCPLLVWFGTSLIGGKQRQFEDLETKCRLKWKERGDKHSVGAGLLAD